MKQSLLIVIVALASTFTSCNKKKSSSLSMSPPHSSQTTTDITSSNERATTRDESVSAPDSERQVDSNNRTTRRPAAPTALRSMNDLLNLWKLQACENEDRTFCWQRVTSSLGIVPCDLPGGPVMTRERRAISMIKGAESGIITSQEGKRSLFDQQYPTTDGKSVRLRFTFDISNDLCGYEIFAKHSNGQVYAIAADGNGNFLSEVPHELAHDKDRNKSSETDSVIRAGQGCMQCHPRVSHDYGMTGAENFWSGIDSDRVKQPGLEIELIADPPL